MVDINELERRLNKLESRINDVVGAQNKVNQKAHDHIAVLEKRSNKHEGRINDVVGAQNKVNQKAHDHIAVLEKRFMKMNKLQKKTTKITAPRAQEKQLMKFVDSALKAYDQKKRK